MRVTDLLEELLRLHRLGERALTVRAAEVAWPEICELPPTSAHGSVCRLAAIAAYDQLDYATGDVWWHRAMAFYRLAGCRRGVVALMITPALRSFDLQHPDVAMMLLEAMEAFGELDDEGADEPYSRGTLLRVVSEHLADCHFRQRRYDDAIAAYERALRHMIPATRAQTLDEVRGELKVRGGLSLARWFGSTEGGPAREGAMEEMRSILARSTNCAHLEHVHRTTVHNLEVLQRDPSAPPSRLHPYVIR